MEFYNRSDAIFPADGLWLMSAIRFFAIEVFFFFIGFLLVFVNLYYFNLKTNKQTNKSKQNKTN